MISIVYGPKGSGKTKALLEKAVNAMDSAKGTLIYITNSKDHIYQIPHQIRYIMSDDYNITDLQSFIGFIKGIIANDHDIEYIFIDGAARISNVNIDQMQSLFEVLDKYQDINFLLTVSSDYDNLPQYIKNYVK